MTDQMLKTLPKEYSFDLYKRMIDGLTWVVYFFIGVSAIGVTALTSTKVSAATKLGSLSVDGDDPESKVIVTTETKVEGPANVVSSNL